MSHGHSHGSRRRQYIIERYVSSYHASMMFHLSRVVMARFCLSCPFTHTSSIYFRVHVPKDATRPGFLLVKSDGTDQSRSLKGYPLRLPSLSIYLVNDRGAMTSSAYIPSRYMMNQSRGAVKGNCDLLPVKERG